MKIIDIPASIIHEKSHYISDFSGQPFKNDILPSTLNMEFNYGSKFDGESIRLHLTDVESKEVLDFLYSKLNNKKVFENLGYDI